MNVRDTYLHLGLLWVLNCRWHVVQDLPALALHRCYSQAICKPDKRVLQSLLLEQLLLQQNRGVIHVMNGHSQLHNYKASYFHDLGFIVNMHFGLSIK